MLELLATTCAGIFAGAAVFISLVQQPAAREVGDEVAVSFFSPMYARAAPMQAGLAVVGSVAAVVCWWMGSGWPWLVGALLLFFVVPFTLVVIKPVNDRLMAPDLDPADAIVPTLLSRWGRLHAVRSVTSTIAFLVFIVAL